MSSEEEDSWERPESADTFLEVNAVENRCEDPDSVARSGGIKGKALYPAGPGVRVVAKDEEKSQGYTKPKLADDENPASESGNSSTLRDSYLHKQDRLFSREVYARRKRQEEERRERENKEDNRLRQLREADRERPPACAPNSPVRAPNPPTHETITDTDTGKKQMQKHERHRAGKRSTISLQKPPLVLRDGATAENPSLSAWLAIWRKNAKIKTRLPIPDTIFVNASGQPHRWLFTSESTKGDNVNHGAVLKRNACNSTWDNIYRVFERKYNVQQSRAPQIDLSTPVCKIWFRTGSTSTAGLGTATEMLSLEQLSQICAREGGEGVLQAHHLRGRRARSDVARLQFHIVGRNGKDVVYENSYLLSSEGAVHSWNRRSQLIKQRRRSRRRGQEIDRALEGDPPAPIMTTDRIREEGGKSRPALHVGVKGSYVGSPKKIKLSPSAKLNNRVAQHGEKSLLRVPSQDRVLNAQLDKLTQHLVQMLQGRSRNALLVRKMTVQYALGTNGAPHFLDCTELIVSPGDKVAAALADKTLKLGLNSSGVCGNTSNSMNSVQQNMLRKQQENLRVSLPEALLLPAPKKREAVKAGQAGGGGASDVNFSADQRQVDFHRRSERLKNSGNANVAVFVSQSNQKAGMMNSQVPEVSDAEDSNQSNIESHTHRNDFFGGVALSKQIGNSTMNRKKSRGIAFGSRCNGDFCSYYEDMKRSSDQASSGSRENVDVRNQSKGASKSATTEKVEYTPWKAKVAIKQEWKALQEDTQEALAEINGVQKEGSRQEATSDRDSEINLFVGASHDVGVDGIRSIKTRKIKQQQLAKQIRRDREVKKYKEIQESGLTIMSSSRHDGNDATKLLLPYRAIADARTSSMRHMPESMLKWMLANRAETRRGEGPWLSVSIPERGRGGSLIYRPGMPVLTVWEWAGSISFVRVQLFSGWDSRCDVQVGMKNSGYLCWQVPTLKDLDAAGISAAATEEALESDPNAAKKAPPLTDPELRGPVWRLKLSDTNNPNVYTYSGRFCIDFLTTDEEAREGNVRKNKPASVSWRARPSGLSNLSMTLQQELEAEEEEEESRQRVSQPGINAYLTSVEEDRSVAPSLRYAQVSVCRSCYRAYCMLDRTKRDRERLKDAGCVLNDVGQVISGVPPFDLVSDSKFGGKHESSEDQKNAVVAAGGVTVDAPDEAQISRSLKNILNEETGDAGIAAMLADADKGMAELLHDLDMAPKKISAKSGKGRGATNSAQSLDETSLEQNENSFQTGNSANSSSGGKRRHRAAAGPPGGNAKARHAKLVKRRRRRNEALANLKQIVSRVSENLSRGLGVSGQMLDELDSARRLCQKNTLVPPTNSILIKCLDLQERMADMPRISASVEEGSENRGETRGIAPSVAWAASGNEFRVTRDNRSTQDSEEDEPFSAPLFVDDEFSDNSDDEEEPFLREDRNRGSNLESTPATMFSANGPAAHLQPPRLPQRDEAHIIAAAAAAVKSAKDRALKKQKKRENTGAIISTISGNHTSASEELDAAILERRATMANTAYGTNEYGGTHRQVTKKVSNQTKLARKKSKLPSKSMRRKENKLATRVRKRKIEDNHVDSSLLSPLRGKLRRKRGQHRMRSKGKRGFPLFHKSESTPSFGSMSFLTRSEQGQLFGAKQSKFDEAMAAMIDEENRELAREIHRRQKQKHQRQRPNVFSGRKRDMGKRSNTLTYSEVRRGMMRENQEGDQRQEDSSTFDDTRAGKERFSSKEGLTVGDGTEEDSYRNRSEVDSPMRKIGGSNKKKRQKKKKRRRKKRSGSVSPNKRRGRRMHKRKKLSPVNRKKKLGSNAFSKLQILSDEHDARMMLTDENNPAAVSLGHPGGNAVASVAVFKSRMPPQLRNNSSLRKVVCLLVLGQLKDVRKLLEIHARSGVQGLARRFSATVENKSKGALKKGIEMDSSSEYDKTDKPLSEDAAWMLENFVCVGQVFVNVWEKRRRLDEPEESTTLRDKLHNLSTGFKKVGMIPGVCRGADVDERIPSTAPDVTMEACGLVRQFLRWFDIPSGLARYHILHGIALWGQNRSVDALDAWRAGALTNKSDGSTDEAVNGKTQLNRYDRAVACFLLGRHSAPGLAGNLFNNNSRGQSRGATPGSERLRWLRRARRGFREIFGAAPSDEEEGRYLELSCVAKEIDHTKEAEGQLQRVTEGPEQGLINRGAEKHFDPRYSSRGVTPATPGANSIGYGSSRPGTSMTIDSQRRQTASGHGDRSSKSRQGISSAASSTAGSILGVSGPLEDEIHFPPTRESIQSTSSVGSRGSSDGDMSSTSGMSFPHMDSVWSKDGLENNGSNAQHSLRKNWPPKPGDTGRDDHDSKKTDESASLGDMWRARRSGRKKTGVQVRFNMQDDASLNDGIDDADDLSISKPRPQTTSRGSMGGTSLNSSANPLLGTQPSIVNARTEERIDLKVAEAMATITGKQGDPNTSSRRPPLASPKKKSLRQGSAGVRRGSPKKSTKKSDQTSVSVEKFSNSSSRPPRSPMRSGHSSKSFRATGNAFKISTDNLSSDLLDVQEVTRRKSLVLDELLASHVDGDRSLSRNKKVLKHEEARTSKNIEQINALHAGADEENRVYQAKVKADRRRQHSSLTRKLTFESVGSEHNSGAQSSPNSPLIGLSDKTLSPNRKMLPRSDSSQSVAQVQENTKTEVQTLKTKLMQERDRQKSEMKRRLEARRRISQRKIRLRATVNTPPTTDSDGGYATGDEASTISGSSSRIESAAPHIQSGLLQVEKAAAAAYGFYQKEEIAFQNSKEQVAVTLQKRKNENRQDLDYLVDQAAKHNTQEKQVDAKYSEWIRAGHTPPEPSKSIHPLPETARYNDDEDDDLHELHEKNNMRRTKEQHVNYGENNLTNSRVSEQYFTHTFEQQKRSWEQGDHMSLQGATSIESPEGRALPSTADSQSSFQRYYNVYSPMRQVSTAETDFDTWRNENFPAFNPASRGNTAGTDASLAGSILGDSREGSGIGDMHDESSHLENRIGTATSGANAALTVTTGGLDPATWKLEHEQPTLPSSSDIGPSAKLATEEKWIYPLMGILQLPTGVLAVTTRLIAGDVLKISISHDESDAFSFMASGDTINGHFVLHVKGDEIVPLLTEAQMELVRDNRKASPIHNRRVWGVNGARNNNSEEDWPQRQLISELADMLDLISNPKDEKRRRLVLRAKDADLPLNVSRELHPIALESDEIEVSRLSSDIENGKYSRGRTPGTRGSMDSRASDGGAVGNNPLLAMAKSGEDKIDKKISTISTSGEVAKDLSDMSGILFRLITQRKSLALKAMLDAGADVFIRNGTGSTLLIEAAKASDIDSLHILISFGGSKLINHPDYEGNTALHYTVANDDGITASFLRANGADESLRNMYGLTPAEGLTLQRGGYGERLNF